MQGLVDPPPDRLLQDALLDDEVDPRDELEELLDDFLDKHPGFDAVVGTWELLFDFSEVGRSPSRFQHTHHALVERNIATVLSTSRSNTRLQSFQM